MMKRPDLPESGLRTQDVAQGVADQAFAARRLFEEGKQARASGDTVAAMAALREVLRLQAHFVPAYHQLALILQAEGRDDEAIDVYEQALAHAPGMAALHCNLASLRLFRGDTQRAIAGFQQAIALDPGLFTAHAQLGKALLARNDFDAALAALQDAVRLDPAAHGCWLECGMALSKLQRYEEALRCYEKALDIQPDHAQTYLCMGVTLSEHKKYHLALLSYDRALALKPDHGIAYYNRALTLGHLNRCAEAVAENEKALEFLPDYADAYWMESVNRLLLGDYKNGWKKHEWRWKRSNIEPDHEQHFPQPLWLGEEDLAGKTILLHAEQGLGDTFQFFRYAKMVAALGARVLLQVYPAARPVLLHFPAIAQVLLRGEPLPDFDYHCPLLSLPLAFKTELASIPANIPYLFSHPARRQKWLSRIGAQIGARTLPRVGIAWSGSPTHLNDKERSISLQRFAGIVGGPGEKAQFFSLQNHVREHDAQALRQYPQIAHFGDALRDFTDTAALIDLMDLVISVDTSVAHLAGAMGKPVWLLLPYNPDWRWMLERSDSPWYPTMRLFRQPHRDDWASVLATVRKELEEQIRKIISHPMQIQHPGWTHPARGQPSAQAVQP